MIVKFFGKDSMYHKLNHSIYTFTDFGKCENWINYCFQYGNCDYSADYEKGTEMIIYHCPFTERTFSLTCSHISEHFHFVHVVDKKEPFVISFDFDYFYDDRNIPYMSIEEAEFLEESEMLYDGKLTEIVTVYFKKEYPEDSIEVEIPETIEEMPIETSENCNTIANSEEEKEIERLEPLYNT